MSERKFYVTMTDKFMSGWGMAENLTNKLVIECPSFNHARAIKDAAEKRSEMKYINIVSKIPHYNSKRYLASHKNFTDLGGHWLDYVKDYVRE